MLLYRNEFLFRNLASHKKIQGIDEFEKIKKKRRYEIDTGDMVISILQIFRIFHNFECVTYPILFV